MVANGLLENPALFAGHKTTPKQCVADWVFLPNQRPINLWYLQLEIEKAEETPPELFHQILVYMLRSSLPKCQRRVFNELKGTTVVKDFLRDCYFLK